jgi:glutamine synthetase
VSFTPIPEPNGVSNGTHIHFSFLDRAERPVLYDESQPRQLSVLGSRFLAGIQHHLPSICAVTAPSPPSYFRLRPDRWAPVKADVGERDRGAALRICAMSGADRDARARQCNVEFRVADATASPYLALAMLVFAGLDGLRRERSIATEALAALPTSLGAALTLLERNELAAEWLGADLLSAYILFKRAEVRRVENLSDIEICRRYAEVY